MSFNDSDFLALAVLERSRMEDAAGLAPTLEDGKRIMALLQKRVLTDQLREHCVAYAVSVRELARSRTAGSG
jgi:predicted hydrolase (HD superfamily)